jgi:hypothetical protein
MNARGATMPDFCSRRRPYHYVTALNVLMKYGVDLSNVNLIAAGTFENYKGEVHGQTPKPGEAITPGTEITLEVGCLSGVDHIPYQFFYGFHGVGDRTDDWELNARKALAPFDSEVIRYHAYAKHVARKFNFGVVEKPHLHRFLRLFAFNPEKYAPDLPELMFWVSAMPLFHKWSGNARAVAAILGRLIGHSVEIVENARGSFVLPEECRSPLGSESSRVGASLIAGRTFSDCDSTYEVIVHGVNSKSVAHFLPGGKTYKKLEWLLSVSMPSFLERRIRIRTRGHRAAIGKEKPACFLGYSSYL